MASNLKGDIVVADPMSNRISFFDLNGKFLKKFGWSGKGNGQFDYPSGVTVDQRNNQIVVADGDSHRIQILTKREPFFALLGRKVKVMGN